MKRLLLILSLVVSLLPLTVTRVMAGEVDILVQKLVDKNILSPSEAQIVLDDTKLQVSKDLAQAKSLSVPDWTQRIKWGGDVRFRTQGDWGKNNTRNIGNDGLNDQRIRNRIRGRFWMEGKVNDFTYSGVRFAGGATGARSTNDTLDDYFSKDYVMFDQYYTRFEAPREVIRDYGKYFNDAKLWVGRFPIPFNYSEMVWDSDINPTGLAAQYVSPDLKLSGLPSVNLYSNGGMFWLTESQLYNNDPMLWAMQGGVKTDVFGPFASTVDLSTAIYNFANILHRNPTGSANTNTRVLSSDDAGLGTAAATGYRFEYNVLDLLVSVDNSKVMDIEFPHGFYADYIKNLSCHNNDLDNGVLVGAYIGKKKIKNPGDWKARAEWRYIERDAIPDFMPDSDFYGFGTYTNFTNGNINAGNNGLPAEGGTNGKGINLAFEYQLFKNTALNIEYYWMKPIKSLDRTAPWNELQVDLTTKF